jgi:uncharacterized membrane protein (DUF373 family)
VTWRRPPRRDGSWVAALLGEFLIDAAVAIALTVGGVILLGVVLYDFVRGLGRDSFTGLVLELLSGLLLVFIFTELISTIRVAIARRSVTVKPFLIVGMVAAIRRLIVISAEAENLLGTPPGSGTLCWRSVCWRGRCWCRA